MCQEAGCLCFDDHDCQEDKWKALAVELFEELEHLWGHPHEGLIYREENGPGIEKVLAKARSEGL